MTHPIVACVRRHPGFAEGAWCRANPTFTSTEDKVTALSEAGARRPSWWSCGCGSWPMPAAPSRSATAARDAAGWLAKETRTRSASAVLTWLWVMALGDPADPILAAAMRDGNANLAQAEADRPSHRGAAVER